MFGLAAVNGTSQKLLQVSGTGWVSDVPELIREEHFQAIFGLRSASG
jgi:hypothetical protein